MQVREYLEKHYQELSGMEAVKMAIKALTETVEAGSKNIEVCLAASSWHACAHAFSGVAAACAWSRRLTAAQHVHHHTMLPSLHRVSNRVLPEWWIAKV